MSILLLLLLASAAAAAPTPHPKRGFVADGCTGTACQDLALLTGASWYYAYNPGDPYAPGSTPPHNNFVPMHWCIPLDVAIPSGTNLTFLLGPNEPNNVHNCHKGGEEIAKNWSTVLANWHPPATALVSPATAGNGIPWLDDFFGNCTALYGPQGCQVTHVAVHDYSCTPSSTMAYLKSVHDRYGLPVWLTEFSCGDGAANKPMADHLAFMKEILPLLDAAPFVYRYAWMSAHSANRGLVEGTAGGQQKLTPVGELFNSV
jgi:hypothetical protein